MVLAITGMIVTSREYRRGSQFGVARQAATTQLLVDLLSAETGSRGYSLTGRDDYLGPFKQASREYPGHLKRLKRLVRDERALETATESVDRAAQRWFAESRLLVKLVKEGQGVAARRRIETGMAKALQGAFRSDHNALLRAVARERRASLDRADTRRRITLAVIAASALLALLVVAAVAHRIWRQLGGPVADLAQGVQRVARGNLSQPVPARPAAVRELRALVGGFNQMQVDLVGQRDAVATAARRDAALTAERELWKTVQSGLLPARLPRAPWMRISARYRPSEADLLIGGDFYDAVMLEDGRLSVVVGDVSGHGASAAAKAAGLRFAWRTMVQVNPDPEAVLHVLNEQIGTPEERLQGRFASLLHLVIDDEGRVDLAPAGHPAPILLTQDDCRPLVIDDPGPPIGVFNDAQWPILRFQLPLGGTLVLFTDGLVEARRNGEEFGIERACRVLEAERSSPLTTRIERLIDAARRFDEANLRDDVVVLALERPALPR